jgi:hypothetical protein
MLEDVQRDIEKTLGYDIVDQEKLVRIAENIWLNVPQNMRDAFTAIDWQKAISGRYEQALAQAEQALTEKRVDNDAAWFNAKIKLLHRTFANQVGRAMQTVIDKY